MALIKNKSHRMSYKSLSKLTKINGKKKVYPNLNQCTLSLWPD